MLRLPSWAVPKHPGSENSEMEATVEVQWVDIPKFRDFFPCNESSLQNRKQGDMKGEMLFPGDLHCTGFGSLIRDTIRQGMMVLVLVGCLHDFWLH